MSIEAVLAVLYATPPVGARNVAALDVFRVWQLIAEGADCFGRGTYPSRSQQTIADELRIDRRTVRNAVAALEAQGRLIKTAAAVPRRSGDVFDVVIPGVEIAPTRAGNPRTSDDATLAGDPRQNTRAIRAGNSGGELGRGTRAGDPRRDPDPDPENPPTPLCAEDLAAATLTDEDLMLITNERSREIIAVMTGRLNGENVHTLFPSIDEAANVDEQAEPEPYEFAHLTPARRRKRARS